MNVKTYALKKYMRHNTEIEVYKTQADAIREIGIIIIKTFITLNSLAIIPLFGFHLQNSEEFTSRDLRFSVLFFYLGLISSITLAAVSYFFGQASIKRPEAIGQSYFMIITVLGLLSITFFTLGILRATNVI